MARAPDIGAIILATFMLAGCLQAPEPQPSGADSAERPLLTPDANVLFLYGANRTGTFRMGTTSGDPEHAASNTGASWSSTIPVQCHEPREFQLQPQNPTLTILGATKTAKAQLRLQVRSVGDLPSLVASLMLDGKRFSTWEAPTSPTHEEYFPALQVPSALEKGMRVALLVDIRCDSTVRGEFSLQFAGKSSLELPVSE